jgi:hypothetical protein
MPFSGSSCNGATGRRVRADRLRLRSLVGDRPDADNASCRSQRPFDSEIRCCHSLAYEEMKEKLASDGAEPEGSTPEAFAALIKSELAKWAKVARAANIEPQ